MIRKLLPALYLSLLGCATSPPPAPIEPASSSAAVEPAAAAEPAAPAEAAPPVAGAEPAAPAAAADPAPAAEPAPPATAEAAAEAKPATKADKSAKRPTKKKTMSAATAAPAPAPATPPAPPAAPAPAKYTGDSPCKGDVDPSGPIGKACAKGGIQAAKTTMKDLTRKGRAAGVKFECDDCHKDDTDYSKLTDNAHKQLEKLLAAVK